MSHLRPVNEAPGKLSQNEAHEAFAVRIKALRDAYPELLTAVGHTSIPSVAYGKRAVNSAWARKMASDADRIVAAAVTLRDAAHSISAIWAEVELKGESNE